MRLGCLSHAHAHARRAIETPLDANTVGVPSVHVEVVLAFFLDALSANSCSRTVAPRTPRLLSQMRMQLPPPPSRAFVRARRRLRFRVNSQYYARCSMLFANGLGKGGRRLRFGLVLVKKGLGVRTVCTALRSCVYVGEMSGQ